MLVAEDRDDEIQLLKLACERAKVSLPLQFVRNGEEAVEYLKGQGRFADRYQYPLPTFLLLDLNMPLRNGFEVLEWLRLQPGLRRLLVIVFTSSDLVEDVNRAFELGANSYLLKPTDFKKLQEMACYLEEYWLKLNRCPDCSLRPGALGAGLRVLLRNPETGDYFQGSGRWTDNPKQALDFEHSERAVQSALGMKLDRFEIIVDLADEKPSSGQGERDLVIKDTQVILVVEDNGNDATLIRTAFRKAGLENPIQTMQNVEEALAYLNGSGAYADRRSFPFPELILLDHKMPGDGWPVIEWVRRRPELALLPVIVFSGSDDPNHQQKASALGANAYQIKPQRFEQFIEAIKGIGDFWLRGISSGSNPPS